MWKRHAIGIAAAMALLDKQGGAVAQFSANYVMTGCRKFAKQTINHPLVQGHCTGVIGGIFIDTVSNIALGQFANRKNLHCVSMTAS